MIIEGDVTAFLMIQLNRLPGGGIQIQQIGLIE